MRFSIASSGDWCLGLEQPENPFLPDHHQTLFAIYSLAAVAYSWVVVLSILWFLQKMLEPYHLQSVGRMIALAAMYGLFIQPLWKLVKFFRVPGRTDQVKKVRLLATTGVVGLVGAAVFALPLPHREYCTLQIQPHDAASVRVVVPGRVEEVLVKPGQRVEAGQLLVRLSNPDLELVIADLKGRLAVDRAKYEGLQQQQFRDDTAALQLSSVHETITAMEDALRQKQFDLSRLDLVAPSAGVVLPPPETPHKPVNPDGQLPGWYGTPLEDRNLGAFLTESTLVCLIGDPQEMQADLVLDQSQIDFVAKGQEVDIKLDHLPLDELHGRITTIALQDMKVTPRNLSNKAGGELPSKTDESGVERPGARPTRPWFFHSTAPKTCCAAGCAVGPRSTLAGKPLPRGPGACSARRSISACRSVCIMLPERGNRPGGGSPGRLGSPWAGATRLHYAAPAGLKYAVENPATIRGTSFVPSIVAPLQGFLRILRTATPGRSALCKCCHRWPTDRRPASVRQMPRFSQLPAGSPRRARRPGRPPPKEILAAARGRNSLSIGQFASRCIMSVALG